ncbi:MAG: double-strand break repair helicase AddA [Rhodobacteraceae bacterium]|nr:double-strand break repair helicase AddA [Paracoccaceae bacterium]
MGRHKPGQRRETEMSGLERFDAATVPQIRASDPAAAAWVSANAGTGKTRVLTNRVTRLLLEGVPPQQILCITFTKVAAINMATRLFEMLAEWSMLPTAELKARLLDLGLDSAELGPDKLREARTLFARALETPGGLRIETIHAFATKVLRRFPLEAGISPQFKVLEARTAEHLQSQAFNQLAAENPELLQDLGKHVSPYNFSGLIESMLRYRESAQRQIGDEELDALFGVPRGWKEDSFLDVFQPADLRLIANLRRHLQLLPGPTCAKHARQLSDIGSPPGRADFELLSGMFMFQSGAKAGLPRINCFPTAKMAREMPPPLGSMLNAYIERIAAAHHAQIAFEEASRTRALLRFSQRFLARYSEAKRAIAALDYEDLLISTRDLLTDSEVSQWVLFRMDDSIDHILVDEAQDVNPIQWSIVAALAAEYAAGKGQRQDARRTVFAVGDEKQSIFGFQGAEPARFHLMNRRFRRTYLSAGQTFLDEALAFSFRSSPAILRLVDEVFAGLANPQFPQEIPHRAFFDRLPGRVDMWAFRQAKRETAFLAWTNFTDMRISSDAYNVLAGDIAQQVKEMLENGDPIPDGDGARPVRPDDILILVQRRNDLFYGILRELSARGIPVAGTDRVRLLREIGVKDLLALLRFLALPEDDLSLASALRSPLFGLSEQDIFTMSAGRRSTVWQSLYLRRNDNGRFREAYAMLADLRRQVDFQTPYELLDCMLTVHGGRARMVARLGPGSDEAIDVLLDQAIAYELGNVPSLTGFLEWIIARETDLARPLDIVGSTVRVMTVHGAKGLEAPVVILPDTATISRKTAALVVEPETSLPVWTPPRKRIPIQLKPFFERLREQDELERLRLMYVALTRAKCWLIVCGAGKKNNTAWYSMIEQAMLGLGAKQHLFAWRDEYCGNAAFDGLRFETGAWPEGAEAVDEEMVEDAPAPEWCNIPVATPPDELLTVSPSSLGGDHRQPGDAGPGEDAETAAQRGTFIHAMLERLPRHDRSAWNAVADRLRLSCAQLLDDAQARDAFDQAVNLLTSDRHARLFAADGLTEVAFTVELPELFDKPLHGIIDRLHVDDRSAFALDFKSNRRVPKRARETSTEILAQMGAYQLALEKLYSDRPVRVAVLWTRTATLMHMPRDLIVEALTLANRNTTLDRTATGGR